MRAAVAGIDQKEDKIRALQQALALENPRDCPVDVSRAFIMCDLAEIYLGQDDTDAKSNGRSLLEEARVIFEEHKHGIGELDVQVLKIRKDPDNEGAPTDLYRRLWELYQMYSDREYIFGQEITLIELLNLASTTPSLQGEFPRLTAALDQVLGETGAKGHKQLVNLYFLLSNHMEPTQRAFASRVAKDFLQDPPDERPPVHMARFAQLVSTAALVLGNLDEALEYARKALFHYETGLWLAATSSAAKLVAGALVALGRQAQEENNPELCFSRLEEAEKLLQIWLESDKKQSNVEQVIEKTLELSEIEEIRWSHLNGGDEAFEKAMHWIAEAGAYSQLQHGYTEYSITSQKCSLLWSHSQLLEALYIAQDAVKEWTARADASGSKYNHPPHFLVAHLTAAAVGGILDVLRSQRGVDPGTLDSLNQIDNAEMMEYLRGLLATALDHFQEYMNHSKNFFLPEARIIASVTRLEIFSLLTQVTSENVADLNRTIIQEAKALEWSHNTQRLALSDADALRSILQKQAFLATNTQITAAFSTPLRAALALGQPDEAWEWVQKAKSRSLEDILSIHQVTPKSLVSAIEDDVEAKRMLEEEDLLLRQSREVLEGLASSQRLRLAIQAHREKMKKHPVLAKVLLLREGTSNVSAELLFQSSVSACLNGREVVYVDWFVPGTGSTDEIMMFVRKASGLVHHKILSIKVPIVQRWIKNNLDFPTDRDPKLKKRNGNKIIRELNPLVEPLKSWSQEDDLLVLCPSRGLYDLPLHALEVDGKPLILRNLVVYAASSGVYRQCISRAESTLSSRDAQASAHASTFMGVYEEIDYNSEMTAAASRKERSDVFNSVEKASQLFGGRSIVGDEVTPETFAAAVTGQDWIHYHGHVQYSRKDIMKQGLALSDSKDLNVAAEHTYEPCYFSIKDVFALDLRSRSPVCVMVGCESGLQRVTAGDEPLGLIAALQYAGASTTLGCLWPIPSATGRFFSEKFYASLDVQRRCGRGVNESGPRILNVALAVRDAVKAMKDRPERDMEVAYFWAPFVLHGAWFSRLDGIGKKG